MTVQITVLGLGQIGSSIGLALADETDQIKRVGHDRNPEATGKAKKMGAFDETHVRLIPSIVDADVVILAEPADQVLETLEIIAPELKPETVVLDTSPLKVRNTERAKEILPSEVFYLTFTPSLNPEFFNTSDSEIESPDADLFKNGLVFITAPAETSQEAYQLALDLSVLLGANSFFADAWESDGLSAAVHTLPQLTAAALIHATTSRPGWKEAQKLAGREYAQTTKPILSLDEAEELGQTALTNEVNVVRVLDNLILELQTLRKTISDKDTESLSNYLDTARDNRLDWTAKRMKGDWSELPAPEYPTAGNTFGRLFGLGKRKKKD